MNKYLYSVKIQHKREKTILELQVWGANENVAVEKIFSILCGPYGEYTYVNSEPKLGKDGFPIKYYM